jgi:hypothetical protein
MGSPSSCWKELLPIAEDLNTTAVQMQVRRTAERLETERGEGQDAGVRDRNALLEPSAPCIVGLDGAYVRAKGQPSRTEGWVEVIVGKRLPTPDKRPKCFGFVSRCDPQPKDVLWFTSGILGEVIDIGRLG